MMKAYDELTYLGRVRRFRQLASVALEAYGLGDAHYKLLRVAGNTLFRVYGSNPEFEKAANGLFLPGQYLLRVHQPDYQASEAIKLELAWLGAMRREANLAVPEPVPTLDGRLLIQVSIPGIPGERNCSLLRWVKGRFIPNGIRPAHYKAQGLLMAQMHAHAAQWQYPEGTTKRRYDWDGLFRDDSGTGIRASEAWALLPRAYFEPFEVVAQQARKVMDEWGKSPEVYGLIHADLGVDANVLFWRGEARAIDFDDSGFGYWIYDLAVSLEHCQEDDDFSRCKDALFDGYSQVCSLPQEQLEHFDLFQAGFHIYEGLWCVAAAQVFPRYQEELFERLERAARLIVYYLESC